MLPMKKTLNVMQLKCGHIFHIDCIRKWLKTLLNTQQANCPNCRTALSKL
jgi:hypothetical protein